MKESWVYIVPSESSTYQYAPGWCPISTVQVFLDDGWDISEPESTEKS